MADLYRGSVLSYLNSALGQSTSPYVAAQLYELQYWLLGLGEEPSHAQLHVTRAWLESVPGDQCDTQAQVGC